MEKFSTVRGVVAPFLEDGINTDDIAPSGRLRSPNVDLGKALFAERRYLADEVENDQFVLNRDPFRQSKVLITGENFGCGSSREMAVWALLSFGFRCIIGRSFGDIFAENAFKNGLLLIDLNDEMEALEDWVRQHEGQPLTIDLNATSIASDDGLLIHFEISEAHRMTLLEGLDEIARSLKFQDDITAFQDEMAKSRSWIVPSVG
jgi:3-isopropylmalate/(R)-2-methylmalate dehydratase small subunit